MMMVKSCLKRSPIHGLGVFAANPIKKGAVVWKLDDRFTVTIHKDQLETLPPMMRKHFDTYGYPHMLKPNIICCDSDNGRFMNHSDNANLVFTSPTVAKAARNIAVGEELTCDYAEFDPAFKGFPVAKAEAALEFHVPGE